MLSLTERAAQQAIQVMSSNDIDSNIAGIKLGVKAGGCSGLNYVLDIVEHPEENDRIFSSFGVRIFCDPRAYLYLNGTEVDYQSTLTGGGFTFNNPNARKSCGCGTSFSV